MPPRVWPLAPSATLEIVTEDYAPANFTGANGEITGIVTDVVRLMAERSGVPVSTALLPFRRGCERVEPAPGRCFTALWRTPARDADFAWVGQPLKDGHALFSRADVPIEVGGPADSFGDTTGAVAGCGSTEAMQAEAHPDLKIVTRDIGNLRKLAAGRLDLCASGLLSAPWQAARADLAIERELVIEEGDLSLAGHPETDREVFDRLDAALADLRSEVVADISASYFDGGG